MLEAPCLPEVRRKCSTSAPNVRRLFVPYTLSWMVTKQLTLVARVCSLLWITPVHVWLL